MQPAVYIETDRPHGTLYVGVTSSLPRRHAQHAMHRGSTFTHRYGLHHLVFYELHPTMPAAIAREKALKNLPRARKIHLIQAMNPHWQDLSPHLQDFK